MDRWAGKVAVITGASSGIGLATAKALIQNGMVVVGLARRKDKMENEMKNVPRAKGKFHAVKCDVANDNDVAEAFNWIKENIGKVQVLINNAGIARGGKFTEVENTVLENIIDVNLMGTVYCTKEILKVLQADNLPGHIININSIVGHRVVKPQNNDMNIYIASKHAITGYTETLMRELLGQNIRVTSLSPGLVKTEIVGAVSSTLAELPILEAEDIADSIIFLLGMPQRVQVNELTITPLGENLL
ncbi:dehydrogenase/reductase SDR family member 11 [Fopius arisanus]|uniref:Dehydrogenase/reductase SDR family member 11 n=2 Tax=Fopius arisanus TaxID=64838 RepID=A0A9R1SYZ8_9HYME|nr:PREDICTED: dehydrogenase/reductase SDR family member 11-like [Fopius arisanus]